MAIAAAIGQRRRQRGPGQREEAGEVIGLLQRVSGAAVRVGGEEIAAIGPGLLVLAAVEREDTPREVGRLAERILGYRVFPDAEGRMNRSVSDAGLELLVVPQFTLAADTRKGMRPSFTPAADPAKGEAYFERLVELLGERSLRVQRGRFGADMQVQLVNDGPVTIWLQS